MTPFIVAEVSKTWINGQAANPITPPLCASFEHIIERNRQRGYRLHSFQLHRIMARPDEMNETIIAVFERSESPQDVAAVDPPGDSSTGTPPPRVNPPRPCGCTDNDLCLHGLPAIIGTDVPVTHRGEYLGISREQYHAPRRCQGTYPVPLSRDEPFPVTYRCVLVEGHSGEHCGDGEIQAKHPRDAEPIPPSMKTSGGLTE